MRLEKRGLLILLVLLTLIPCILAQANATKSFDKGYQCLTGKLGDNCGNSANTEETAFNLLAMSHNSNIQSDCRSSLEDKKQNNCYGSTKTGACNIKSTSIAVIALDNINRDTKDSTDWIKTKAINSKGLDLYLEIDTNTETECNVNGQKFKIGNDKKITGSNPSGLTKAYDNYWFRITDLSKNYTVSCDQDFITALLYSKAGEDGYYVSSNTKTAP